MYLSTARLHLLPLPLSVVRRRLQEESFEEVMLTSSGPLSVVYPVGWPGKALGFFPLLSAQADERWNQWSATVVRREDSRAVGYLGVKGEPDAAGWAEIGYGFNPDVWSQGYATEAVAAFVAYLERLSEVKHVWARTAISNFASARVLEKVGFTPTRRELDAQNGEVQVWEREYQRPIMAS